MLGKAAENMSKVFRFQHAGRRLRAALAGKAADFARRLLARLRKLAHFVGDDRKAGTLFAGAGGFDRGVEGKEVGAEADLLDRRYELIDFARGGVHLADGAI